jgi:hypothetical protein
MPRARTQKWMKLSIILFYNISNMKGTQKVRLSRI